jgi:hypothetical protein
VAARRRAAARTQGRVPGPKRPEARLREVERLVASYAPRREIESTVARTFGCSERTVRADVAVVWERLAAADVHERAGRKLQMRATLRRLFAEAESAGDLRTALAVLDRLCKLDGLDAPTQLEVGGEVTVGVAAMTSGERRDRLTELLDAVIDRVSAERCEVTARARGRAS